MNLVLWISIFRSDIQTKSILWLYKITWTEAFSFILWNFPFPLNCFQTNWMAKSGQTEKRSHWIFLNDVPFLSSAAINRRQSVNSPTNFSVCSLIFDDTSFLQKSLNTQWGKKCNQKWIWVSFAFWMHHRPNEWEKNEMLSKK